MVRSHARHPRLGFRPHRPETRSGKGRNGTSRHGGGGGWRAVFWIGMVPYHRWIAGSVRFEQSGTVVFVCFSRSALFLALENRRFLLTCLEIHRGDELIFREF